MPWPIRIVESREAARAAYGYLPVGAMWPAGSEARPWSRFVEDFADLLSPEFFRDHDGKREAYFVKLPDGSEFCIDARVSGAPGGPVYGDHGWTVTGTPPAITLSPSINCVGTYHGWIQNGVITDDCEGRQFPNARGFP